MKQPMLIVLDRAARLLLLVVAAGMLAQGWFVPQQAARVVCAAAVVGLAVFFPDCGGLRQPLAAGLRFAVGRRMGGQFLLLGVVAGLAALIGQALPWQTGPNREVLTPANEVPEASAVAAAPWWPGEAPLVRALPLRLRLQPSAEPQVLLRLLDPHDSTTDLAGRCYVSAFAMGVYRDGAWSLSPALASEEKRRSSSVFPQRRGRSILHEVQALRRGGEQSLLLSLQGRVATEARPVAAPWQRDEWLATAEERGVPASESRPLVIDDLDAAAQPVAAAEVPPYWLELVVTDEQRAALRALTPDPGASHSWKQRLIDMRERLRGGYQHTLEIRNPQGRDPLSLFLLEEKKGHCELFATAAALAARQMGIAARVAYGWHGGRSDPAGRWQVFAAEDAHAWAEVLIAGEGWVVLDATPLPSQQGVSVVAQSMAAAQAIAPTQVQEHGNWSIGGMLVMVAVAAASMIGLALWRRHWRGFLQHRRNASRQEPAHPLAQARAGGAQVADDRVQADSGMQRAYAARLIQRCRSLGLQPQPGHTLRQLVARWSQCPPWIHELVRYHYGTSYEQEPRNAELERMWTQRLQEENGKSG